MTSAQQVLSQEAPPGVDAREALLRQARAGDADAVRELLAEHREALFGIAWSYLQDREEALDACQEALARGLKALGGFDPRQSMGAWLARILRNVCLDRLRRLRYRRHASLEERKHAGLPDPQSPRESPEDRLLRAELRERITDSMARLRPEEREVLYLREVLAWPYAKIEAFLGLSHGTVASLIHRARRSLREDLEGYVQTKRGPQQRRTP